MKLEETGLAILNFYKKNKLKNLKYLFVDLNGCIRTFEVTWHFLENNWQNGCQLMFDGSSIPGYSDIQESDLFLMPDFSSISIEHWDDNDGVINTTTASIFCDIHNINGTPYERCSRSFLKKQIKLMMKKKYQNFYIGFEPEFFLFKKRDYLNHKLLHSDDGSYSTWGSYGKGNSICRKISHYLQKSNIQVEKFSHEVANSQYEINCKYDDAIKACDNFLRLKIIVSHVANENGLSATFMPKPLKDINGSGLHTNFSIFQNNKNIFSGTKKKLSKKGERFVANILSHICEISLITNPSLNSYKRLNRHFEAPIFVSASYYNRSALIRIPEQVGKKARAELRNVDSTANPYLMCGVLLNIGLSGLPKYENNLKKYNIEKNLYLLNENEINELGISTLPRNVYDSLNQFKKSKLSKSILGSSLFNAYIKIKQQDLNNFTHHITEWEIDKYFNV